MPYPTPAGSVSELMAALDGIASITDDRLVVEDEGRFRDEGIRSVVWSATFSADAGVVDAARWIVWEASQALGARSASIHELYMARGRGEIRGFTVPAVNLRTQVFDMAAHDLPRGAGDGRRHGHLRACPERAGVHVPAARRVHHQRSRRLHRGRLAARPYSSRATTTSSTRRSTRLIPTRPPRPFARRRATRSPSGYGNIDVDSSTLVDLSLPTVDEQQATNYQRAADISALIREVQPAGLTVSIGGEIGEVGKQNSTEEELRAYLDGYYRELERRAGPGVAGHLQGQRPDRHEPRRRAAARRRRR